MKAGWQTRPAERQYFEGKLAALRMANNPTNNHDRWINLANPGKTQIIFGENT